MASKTPDPAEIRAALAAVQDWLHDETAPAPERSVLAHAVRVTARALAAAAPGATVEVRIPPFAAVQCISGPRHTRGTPPNVVETDAWTWLLLVSGAVDLDGAASGARLHMSGSRAREIARYLPLVGD